MVHTQHQLSFEDFKALIADLLQVEITEIEADSHFVIDLGADSIRLVQVLITLEELGIEISPELAWEITTVGDAYAHYKTALTRKS